MSHLPKPLSAHALSCDDEDSLLRFIVDCGEAIGRSPDETSAYIESVRAVVTASKSTSASVATPAPALSEVAEQILAAVSIASLIFWHRSSIDAFAPFDRAASTPLTSLGLEFSSFDGRNLPETQVTELPGDRRFQAAHARRAGRAALTSSDLPYIHAIS